MREFTLLLFTAIVLLAGNLISTQASATHAAGGEITYEWVSDSTYKIFFKFYRDCSGTTEPSSITVCYRNTCNNNGGSLTLNKMLTIPGGSNGTPVVTPCPGTSTTCNGGSYPGYREWWYSANVTLNGKCNSWYFWTVISARNGSINNIVNPGSQNLYIEASLNNLAAQGNSSPYFTVKPVPYVCVNQPYTYNNGVVDPNSDSLTFEMIQPRTQSGSCASYPNGATDIGFTSTSYNLTDNPFGTGNTFNLSSSTGQMSFTPNTLGASVVTMRVKEWRNGVLIGTILRDIQIVVITCSNPQPVVTPVQNTIIGAQFSNGQIQGCATQQLSFCVDMKSPSSSAVLVVTDNHSTAAPGSTIAYTGLLTDSVRACLTWTPSPLDTGLRIFTLTVKDPNCTTGGVPISQTFSVPVYIWPLTTILKDTIICPNDSVTLRAVGGGGFTWTVLPGGSPLSTLSCTNCANPVAKPLVTTQYVVTSSLTSICNKNKDTVTIVVSQVPVFNLGPDTTTCINNSLQLNANLVPAPGTTYGIQWAPALYLSNDTIANPVTTPTSNVTYVVTITPNGQNRCAVKDTLNVKVLQGYKLWNKDTAVCFGATINVNATGDPGYNYTWSPAIGVNGVNLLNPAITPDTSRRYTITASYPGCADSVSSFYVDVQPGPVVYVGPDRTLCYGDTAHLHGVVTPPFSGYTYTWTPGGGLDNASIADPIFTALTTTTLTMTAQTSAGRKGSDDVKISVVPADFMTVSSDTSLCPGDSAQLHVTGTFSNLQWYPDLWINDRTSTDPIVRPVTSTTYYAIATDVTSCIDTQKVHVTVHPGALISLPDSVTIFPGETYQMDPGGNALYFTWFPPLGLSNPNIANPIAQPSVNTRYFVNATTEAGCPATDSIDVFVSNESYIEVPNAFSPGSYPNDKLYVVHRGEAKVHSFTIFNRWGTRMFQSADITKGWDGTLNGVPQPMGVYVYMVEASTPTGRRFYKQGNVTLIR